MATENIEAAEGVLEEVKQDKDEFQADYDAAKYELERANNRHEYEAIRPVYDAAKEKLDALLARETLARDSYDTLSEEVGGLKEAYDNATTAREDKAEWMRERNEDVATYDPKEGPPQMPEAPVSTDDSSNQDPNDPNAVNNGDVNQGDQNQNVNQGDQNQNINQDDQSNQGDAVNNDDQANQNVNQ
jgi:hypothetical protein